MGIIAVGDSRHAYLSLRVIYVGVLGKTKL